MTTLAPLIIVTGSLITLKVTRRHKVSEEIRKKLDQLISNQELWTKALIAATTPTYDQWPESPDVALARLAPLLHDARVDRLILDVNDAIHKLVSVQYTNERTEEFFEDKGRVLTKWHFLILCLNKKYNR